LIYSIAVHKDNLFSKVKSLGVWGLFAGTLLSATHLFFTLGIQRANVANVLVIFASNPMFSGLFSWIFLKEGLKIYTLVAMLVCISRIIYIFYDQMGGSSSNNDILRNCFALIASIAMGAFFVVVRFMEERCPDRYVLLYLSIVYRIIA
jgi:drug/metabolite transporter (DMT)-like permease